VASRLSSRRDSGVSDSDAEERLLEEADALLPHGLPLRAYRVAAPAGAAVPAGMRLAAVGSGAPASSLPAASAASAKAAGGGGPPGGGEPTLTLSLVPSAQRRAARPSAAPADAVSDGKRGELRDSEVGEPSAQQSGHKFLLHGATLNPAGSEARDSLSYRVECLRVFLDAVMGEEAFMRVYRKIAEQRGIEAAADAAGGGGGGGTITLSKTVQRALAKHQKGLHSLVFQLFHCEEEAFRD
jgi:hypothetical protein